ncbi:hypothetical protein Y032_0002g809 [Ancylostoma ceylanicum]|uniref:Uncharacterized protein n=1 Tax=Ancylostoma ceylanicum TaxID=53326 RepID=A0A016W1D0_9BILA|nr:hypothetical protein Y032_0002g809 [Ancylostoma ceylanicum]
MREKGASQATLIGVFGPPTTPICWNSNGVKRMTHGLFVLSAVCAVRVKQVGVTSGSNAPIRVVWLHPLSPHDDTHPEKIVLS